VQAKLETADNNSDDSIDEATLNLDNNEEEINTKIKENQVNATKPTNQKVPLDIIFVRCPANCFNDKAATNITVFGSK